MLSSKPIIYSDSSKIEIIGKHILVFEDKSKKLNIDDLIGYDDIKFDSINSDVLNLGVSKANFWLKFSIKNELKNSNLLLELNQALLDLVEFYKIDEYGNISIIKINENQPIKDRKHKHPNYIFDINIAQNKTEKFFLKIYSSEQIIIPIALGKAELIQESIYSKDLLAGIFTGVILIMFIYNLFIFISTKDESYLYYVSYIILLGITHMTLQGYTHKYIWPNAKEVVKYSVPLLSSSVGIAAMLFVKNFLQTKLHVPTLNKTINISILIFCISIFLSILNFQILSFQLMQINTVISSLVVFYIGYKLIKKGFRLAKFFMPAWSFLLFGSIIFLLKDFAVLPFNTFTHYSMQFGSILEVSLLSFALADRIKVLKEEKENAQAKELKEREAKERILMAQAKTLKVKVFEATKELQTKNNKLQAAYRNLEVAKSELIQKEKITALGLMAAGTAHEFNNANTIVKLALDVIEINMKYFEDYLNLIDEILPQAKEIEEQLKNSKYLKKKLNMKPSHLI